MAQNPDLRRTGTYHLCTQEVEGPQRVEREIGRRGTLQQTPPLLLRHTEATVVVTQHGDPAARQEIGDHQERLVAEHLFVAVLLPASGHQHHGGRRTLPGGQRQRTAKRHALRPARKRHLAAHIGIGRPRLLRPGGRSRIAASEQQREIHPALPEHPDEHISGQQRAPVGGLQRRNAEDDLRTADGDRIHGNSPHTLIGAVQHGLISPLRSGNAEQQPHAAAIDGERTLPHAGKILRRGAERHETKREENEQSGSHGYGIFPGPRRCGPFRKDRKKRRTCAGPPEFPTGIPPPARPKSPRRPRCDRKGGNGRDGPDRPENDATERRLRPSAPHMPPRNEKAGDPEGPPAGDPDRPGGDYFSFGPAATSFLPSSLPVNFVKFLTKRPARSSAFTSQSLALL